MAVLDLILISLAVTVEPIPVTGFILVLSSERGTGQGASYLAAWSLSLVALVAVAVVVAVAGTGAAAVAHLHVSGVQSSLLLLLFAVLCISSILLMELYAVHSPDAARERMDSLREWVDDHRDRVIVSLALIVGCWLIGDNVYLVGS